jgi:Zn finger protein HypA/HybF involved in hydrogenase expression
MHELSLALEVCRIAEAHLPPPPRPRVLALGVEVGDDAGIEVSNFRFCLEALLTDPPFSGARPEILPTTGPDLRLAWVEVDDGRPAD